METHNNRPSGEVWNPNSRIQTVALVCLVAAVSYFAPRLLAALMLNPKTVWPLWPDCALLVSVLLLVPQRLWVMLIPASFLGFVLYDVEAGVPLRSIAWFIPADTAQVLIAACCLRYFFHGPPRLNSVSNLTKYLLLAVVLAPSVGAFLSAPGIGTDYWSGWRISFLSEALAFLTLTPAILSWFNNRHVLLRQPRGYYVEGTALLIGLALLGYLSFTTSTGNSLPALLYSLVPLLLWSALRFGSLGMSLALIVVAFLSIWGAVHGRGPFVERGTLSEMLSIQLFLTFTATPFLILASLAEERTRGAQTLQKREEDLLEAQRVAQVGSWQWNPKTDKVAWSKELFRIAGCDSRLAPPTFKEQPRLYTRESWERLKSAVAEAIRAGTPYQLDLEIIRPDGHTRWITDRGEALHDSTGEVLLLRGTAQDITERKHAEDALRESEEKFRTVFRNASAGMVIVSPEGGFLAANEAFCDCLGYTEEELLAKTIESITLREDWPSFSQKLAEVLEFGTSFTRVEKHCVHKSGRMVTTECSAFLIRGPRGEPRYLVEEVVDVTQRKQAEEALSSVSRRLIEAHEEERTWIARELHDDFGQRVALLAVNLEHLKQGLSVSEEDTRRRVHEVGEYVSDLGSDIQALSHRLHSSKLEYLGLAAASAGFCREFSARQNVEIDFRAESIPKSLPKEVSLCLFRVMQEALQNAVKHSGTRHFEVSLMLVSNELQLSVRDSGVGFDPESQVYGQGLGLTSMSERLKLVDGELSIESKLNGGTTIYARAPLMPRAKSAQSGR